MNVTQEPRHIIPNFWQYYYYSFLFRSIFISPRTYNSILQDIKKEKTEEPALLTLWGINFHLRLLRSKFYEMFNDRKHH